MDPYVQESEFEEFVRTRRPSLMRAAYLLTGDRHLADDLVQTALARTHRSWNSLTESANAEAYTRKVMYHLQVSWWRRRKVAEVMPGDLPDRFRSRLAEDSGQIAVRLSLRAALGKLTAKQRAVLVLRFFEDRSEIEAAESLGVSVGTVKSQTSKALARLREVAPELNGILIGPSR